MTDDDYDPADELLQRLSRRVFGGDVDVAGGAAMSTFVEKRARAIEAANFKPPETRPFISEHERSRTLSYPNGLTEHLSLVVGSGSLVIQRTIRGTAVERVLDPPVPEEMLPE